MTDSTPRRSNVSPPTPDTSQQDKSSQPDESSAQGSPEPRKVSLSLTQVLASVLAAVSASIAASVFGVAGTVIGAGLGSAISVVGGAVYARSLERSREAARLALAVATARRLGVRGATDPAGPPDPPARSGWPGRRLRLALTPQWLALGAGALFVLTMGLITGFELLTGQPVAASVEGKQGSGVSVLGGTERSDPSPSPVPSGVGSTAATSTAATSTAATSTAATSTAPSTAGPTPSGTGQPTPTVTVTVTPSPTPSASQPTGSATPPAPATGSPTGSPDGTPGG